MRIVFNFDLKIENDSKLIDSNANMHKICLVFTKLSLFSRKIKLPEINGTRKEFNIIKSPIECFIYASTHPND